MKRVTIFLALGLAAVVGGAAEPGAVPKGELTKYVFTNSVIFPGTTREYVVYVPRQYDPAKPACLHVNQDGVQFNAPDVFDRLIASGAMPVTIGVFVKPGVVKALTTNALDRFNRSFEYDGMGAGYASFLIDELLPEVEKKKTSDGRAIKFSHDGNDRSIGGSSSGAICAFTAAWERPDAFRRVFSSIGTYVGLRGGNEYPTLIRKTEPKPLRVFLQDGSNDLNIYGGDWWMANQEMERALRFAGYEVNHVWGEGGHNGKHATEIFADAMTWLWKDWPHPIAAGSSSNAMLHSLLLPGQGWQEIKGDYTSPLCLAANAKGEVFSGRKEKVGLDGNVYGSPIGTETFSLAFTPQGELVIDEPTAAGIKHHVVSYDWHGQPKALLTNVWSGAIVTRWDGSIYFSESGMIASNECSQIWLLRPGQKPRAFRSLQPNLYGMALSPDQSQLYVGDLSSPWVNSFQICEDGTLTNEQNYFHLHMPPNSDVSGGKRMCVDREGRLYVATGMGIQICDQAGRVNVILPVPAGNLRAICFGGEKHDVLFITSGGHIYKRKLNTRGINPEEPPFKPAAPRL